MAYLEYCTYIAGKPENDGLVAYLDYRREHGMRGGYFLLLALAAYLNGDRVVLAKVPTKNVVRKNRKRSFRVPEEPQCFENLFKYPKSMQTQILLCALRNAIEQSNETWIMPEEDIMQRYMQYYTGGRNANNPQETEKPTLVAKPVKQTTPPAAPPKKQDDVDKTENTGMNIFSGSQITFVAR